MSELRIRAPSRKRRLANSTSTEIELGIDTTPLHGLKKSNRELALHSMAMGEDSDDDGDEGRSDENRVDTPTDVRSKAHR